MPLSRGLSQWLSSQGHDAVHASDVGLSSAPDTQIIEFARAEGRIVVTADLDYPRLLALSTADRPAVILFRGGDWSGSAAIERLKDAFVAVPVSEVASSLVVIEKTRIRRRALPL
jgi:predicted nuclease of predicted toxin-antitoxin system